MRKRGDAGGSRPASGRDRAADRPPPPSWRSSYTIFVWALKIGLPVIAAGLVLLVIVWPRLFPARTGVAPPEADLAGKGEEVAMTDPRYVGRDAENRPFTVRAQRAHRTGENDQNVYLAQPHGRLTLDNGRSLAASAESGRYRQNLEILSLNGNVTVRHSSGYALHTSAAKLDLNAGTATSDRPVAGHGPAGTVHAQGMKVLDGGDTVVFTGRSQIILNATPSGGSVE